MAQAPVSMPELSVLGSQIVDESIFEGLRFKTLLKCIAWRESSWNARAIGDQGRAVGLLQFHKETWERYCQGDRKDPRAQLECADKMLSENFNNIWHWTTARKCLRK